VGFIFPPSVCDCVDLLSLDGMSITSHSPLTSAFFYYTFPFWSLRLWFFFSIRLQVLFFIFKGNPTETNLRAAIFFFFAFVLPWFL